MLVGLIGAVSIACDRTDLEYANVKKDRVTGAPEYSASASETSTGQVTYVAAVLPQGEVALDGQALFATNCAACHQMTGGGIPGAFPPLNKSPYVLSEKTDRMASIIIYGLQGPVHVLGQEYNNVMAPLGGSLKDDQIAAIMNYIRTAWDNKGQAKGEEVKPALIAEMRKKHGARASFNIKELGEEG